MFLSTARPPRFSFRVRVALLGSLAAVIVPAGTARGQAAPPAEAPDSVIEWNFQPVSGGAAAGSLEARWAAPFAVESSGRPVTRAPRPVVVLRDSAAARRMAAAQAAAGESAAEVSVGPAAPGGSAGAEDGPQEDTAPPATRATERRTAETRSSSSETPAAAPPARAAARPAAAEGARTHQVEYGETWYGIARQYRVSSDRLAAANPDVDPERLRSGTVLRIPAAGAVAAASRTHTVTRGDTLFGIARRYGVTAAAIRSANRLTDDVVRLGQTLVIPREEASR